MTAAAVIGAMLSTLLLGVAALQQRVITRQRRRIRDLRHDATGLRARKSEDEMCERLVHETERHLIERGGGVR